ncbi:MAG: hypothetical protein ACK4RK_17090 [Gemmataceae bacterium]
MRHCLVAVVLTLGILPVCQGLPIEDASPWLRDYDTALQQARRAGKPVFVVFRCEH